MPFEFLAAIALVLIIEGAMPFINPARWKRFMKMVMSQDDRTLRIYGFSSMFVGVVLLTIVHQFVE